MVDGEREGVLTVSGPVLKTPANLEKVGLLLQETSILGGDATSLLLAFDAPLLGIVL